MVFTGHTPLLFSSHLAEEETAGYFTSIMFQLSCGGLCSVTLPRGAVSWSLIMAFPGHSHVCVSIDEESCATDI